ncbi:MAG: DUF6351 family protein [Thermodesulfobacteriota bacterium]
MQKNNVWNLPVFILTAIVVLISWMPGHPLKILHAEELTLLGPVKCERTKGKKDIYTYEFTSMDEQKGFVLGTLLVWNGSPYWMNQVTSAVIRVNGKKVATPDDFRPGVDVLQIPLDNLSDQNTLEVDLRGRPGSFLMLQVAELGEQGPKFSGPQQYPFVCRTEKSGLGQPIVDNYEGDGVRVFKEDEYGNITDEFAGYCKDCSTVTRVDYFYRTENGEFRQLDRFSEYPEDLTYTETNDGFIVPYIIRLERGTINRFIYGIAMLDPWGENGEAIEAWNQKLFYRFSGGVAIGHDQGNLGIGSPLYDEALSRGYAVAYSTGNRTGVHYNLQLAGETAIMVKDHFVNRFGEPEFTMSIGGSGGAIQQYILAQNHPGLLNGIIPQRSYSDMITQTIYVGDCMLMEYYFDVIAPAQGDETFGGFAVRPDGTIEKLGDPEKRQLLEGMSTSNEESHPIYTELTGETGSTECVNGWLGLTPLVMNPLFTDVSELEQIPDEVVEAVKWTHWDDLKNIYGVDENGYAPSTWDNVGVQYGLESLRNGDITLEQFLDINARIGGWEKPDKMVPEGYPFSESNEIQYLLGIEPNPNDFDPWSIRNSTFSSEPPGSEDYIAPRTVGNVEAMHDAYKSGQVFIGKLEIPAIDIRDYLDPKLDMHHAQQSFATRKRIKEFMGHSKNQLIWMKDPESSSDITVAAIEMMDAWLTNIQNNPNLSVYENRPGTGAVDQCFYEDGSSYKGPEAWDGILNEKPDGPCTEAFPLFSTSRILAGGGIEGDVFKCHLMPVEEAIERGLYGDVEIDADTQAKIEAIFPNGVCDYSKGDAGRPEDLDIESAIGKADRYDF